MDRIIDIIGRYLDLSSDEVDHAVFLNGPWGSGKTYFWKKRICPLIEEKRLMPIYISLYGVSDVGEIGRKIFLDTIPLLNLELVQKLGQSKLMEIGKVVIGAGINLGIKKIGLDTSDIKPDIDILKLAGLSKAVLCFDDLERSEIEIGTILGYINNFVEHDAIKTIIIGNEEEIQRLSLEKNIELKTAVAASFISGDQNSCIETVKELRFDLFNEQSRYEIIKEKLIGVTISYPPHKLNWEEIVTDLISIYDEPYKGFLKDNLQSMLHVFQQSETKNLRILKHAISKFKFIFKEVYEEDQEEIKNYLDHILYSFLTWSIEFEAGRLKKIIKELNSIKSDLDIAFRVRGEGLDTMYLKTYCKRYYPDQKAFNFSKTVYEFITTGFLDTDILEAEVASAVSDDEPEPLTTLQHILGDYWSLSDEDFSSYCEEVYNGLADGQYSLPAYSKAIYSYWVFSREGLFNRHLSEIVKDLKFGAEKASKLKPYYDVHFNSRALNAPGAPEEVIEYIHFLEEINNQNKLLQESALSEEIWKLVDEDFKEFCRQLYNRYEEYSYISMFTTSRADLLHRKLCDISNEEITSFRNALDGRYSFANIGEYFYDDLEGLKCLKEALKKDTKAATTNPISLRNFLFKVLINTIDDICKRLENNH